MLQPAFWRPIRPAPRINCKPIAAKEHAHAQYGLGNLYYEAGNRKKVAFWWKQAADQAHEQASVKLKTL